MKDATKTPADAVREDILMRAQDLFAHYGFNKTNIGDIAERCSMSPGNLYRYFRNKQAIGLAVVQKFFDMSETAMDTVLMIPEGTPEQRIRRFVTTGIGYLVREMEANPKIVELADFLCNDQEGDEILAAHIKWRKDRLTREIARGMERGDFAPGDPAERAHVVHAAVKPFFVPMMLAHRPQTPAVMDELTLVLDLIFDGLNART